MAVTDVQGIKFVNEQVRPAADLLARAYYLAKSVRDQWYAKGMDQVFQTGGGAVEDGSATDGRTPITADDVLLLITRCQDMVTDLEASGGAKLNTILKPAVNPR